VGKTEGKRAHGKPRRRWEDNIRMEFQEVECEGMDWIELAQNRDWWRALEDGKELSGSMKCGEFLENFRVP